jgi:hypothetical protein
MKEINRLENALVQKILRKEPGKRARSYLRKYKTTIALCLFYSAIVVYFCDKFLIIRSQLPYR